MKDLFINVAVSQSERERIERQERLWTAPRLVALGAVTLALAMTALSVMSRVWYWLGWLK